MTIIKSNSAILVLTLIVPLLLAGVSASVGGGRKAAIVGRWRQIKDLNSPEVQEVAEFAVTEYNGRKSGTNLEYQRVVDGWTQVVAGTNYRLVIAAKDGAVSGNYEAVVWVKPWEHFRNLTSFTKLSG